MNSVLATKSETGMWCKKVEFELDRFIFVAPKPLPEEEWTKLCEKYGEHQTRVLVGDALLIDLRGKEPKFVSIPADFKGDFRASMKPRRLQGSAGNPGQRSGQKVAELRPF